MLYDYIITNYQKDEPIFLEELPGKSRDSVRQEMKKLTDEGKIELSVCFIKWCIWRIITKWDE